MLSSSPSVSFSIPACKARSITHLAYPFSLRAAPRTAFLPLQRRNYADEAVTQSEPEADGATEAQHGDNSIAASADANSSSPAEQAEEHTAASNVDSATERATEQASSAADSVKSAAQTAGEAVTGAAQSLSAAAGLGSQIPGAGRDTLGGETSKTVYVGNLFFDVRNEDLKKEFERAGPVIDARIIMDQRGLSKGFGYVNFETVEAAQRAIELYNMQNFEGRRLSVQFSLSSRSAGSSDRPQRQAYATPQDRPTNPPSKTLFIGNMSFDMSDRDLNNLFREIKNVIDVRVAIDRRTGQPRGFAHADFTDVASAERAMTELSGKVVCGRSLRIDFSTSTGRAAVGGS